MLSMNARRTIALYNLDYHHIRPKLVLDAGTDQQVAKFTRRSVEMTDFAVLQPREIMLDLSGAGYAGTTEPESTSDHAHDGVDDDAASTRSGKGFMNKIKRIGVHLRPRSNSHHAVRPSLDPHEMTPTSTHQGEMSEGALSNGRSITTASVPHATPRTHGQNKVTTSYVWEIKQFLRHPFVPDPASQYEGAQTKGIQPGSAEAHAIHHATSRVILKRILEQFGSLNNHAATSTVSEPSKIAVWFEWVREWNGGLDNANNLYDPAMHGTLEPASSSARISMESRLSPMDTPQLPETDGTFSDSRSQDARGLRNQGPSLRRSRTTSPPPRHVLPGAEHDNPDLRPWTCSIVLDGTTRIPVGRLVPAPHHPLVLCELLLPSPLPDLRYSALGADGGGFSREELRDIVSVTAMHLVIRESMMLHVNAEYQNAGGVQEPQVKPAVSSTDAASHDAASNTKIQYLTLLRHNLALLQRSVLHVEQRYAARVLRSLPYVRRQLLEKADVLALVVDESLKEADSVRRTLLAQLPSPYQPEEPAQSSEGATAMEEDKPANEAPSDEAAVPQTGGVRAEALPECVAYLRLLVVVYLLDQPEKRAQSMELCAQALDDVVKQNRRSLDLLGAKLIFFLARCYELSPQGLSALRDKLLALQRTSSLRHDAETNATVQNVLLRMYIVEGNLYDQADKLVARATFPRAKASNPQVARYDYYVGRIRAVQLNYSDAHTCLQQAIRRAPQQGLLAQRTPGAENAQASKPLASGFLQTAHKLLIIVELLMGDLPERALFRIPMLRHALASYLPIVQAVRVGDLSLFQTTLQQHEALFLRDKTYSLILRLRHNVIKTGIRRISLAYSRISLADITRKLHLDSEEDAEYVIAKAIRDGVIDARVEHDSATMVSNEAVDIYATNEPQTQLQQRIDFCLQLHNDSVKAMRYSLDSHRAELASATAAHERERELANEIADGDMDESDEDWP
ncbi:26S proteasome non-ATPase regulatory subunit [Malassezia caprae]|uniref:26S proteasome non-ATPase regulatory subunit n=1 Tax=Malassezia caprae TaxID=1381934 RepID=A0AAF0E3I4_9BASI|nr:26S proteasome non-ATPase regulatory subunit [Malassezia caprae]